MTLKSLVYQKKIRRAQASADMVVKELDAATNDLRAAQQSMRTGDYKWATVQAYYSMSHAARALLYHMGFRDESPQGLLAALHQLYEKEIVDKILRDFSEAMTLAELALEGHVSSESSARSMVEKATDFLEQAARILAAPREWFEKPASRRSYAKTKRR